MHASPRGQALHDVTKEAMSRALQDGAERRPPTAANTN